MAGRKKASRQLCSEAQNAVASREAIAGHLGKLTARIVAFAGMAIASSFPAAAQSFVVGTPNQPYAVVALPGFDASGIASGEFLLKSQISSGVAYDSNILRSRSAAPDCIFFVAPSFDLTRDAGKHVEEVFASVTSARYARSEADNFNNFYVRANETYLLAQGNQILASASFADGYERRVSTNHDIPSDAAAPAHEQGFLGSLGYRTSWQRAEAGVTLAGEHLTYDNVRSVTGTLLDQSFRNEDDLSVTGFLNLRLSRYIQNDMTLWGGHSEIKTQLRDSNQWRFADNLKIELTSKTGIGFLAAVSEQDYYNNPQSQVRPLGEYEVQLHWSPVQQINFAARAGYHDLGVNFISGITAGGVGRYSSLDFSYLIRRDLLFTSSLSLEKMDLAANMGTQSSIRGQAALTYEFNTNAGLSFSYMYQKLDASGTQFTSYEESIVQTSINLRF